MRIVLIRQNIFAEDGASKVLIDLANELYIRGHSVSIVIDEKKIRYAQKPFFYLNPDINIHNLRPLKNNIENGNKKVPKNNKKNKKLKKLKRLIN